ncbi:hypothetical protein ACHAXT_000785 [Thalassiosira profunda]
MASTQSTSLRALIEPGVSKRTDFPLRPSSMALLVIDIQQELTCIDERSSEYKRRIAFPRMVANTRRLIEAVRGSRDRQSNGRGPELVFTYLEALKDDCSDLSWDYKLSGSLSDLPGPSSPAKFLDAIAPVRGRDIALPKTSCSVFQSTNLDYILRNLSVEQLVVCGQLTDQCVESAVRDAADFGYLVSVVEDACGAESEDCHAKGLHGMKGFARRVTTEQVLEELRGSYNAQSATNEERLPTQNASAGKESSTTPTDELNTDAISIPQSSEYVTNKDQGCHAAILRSLRAAGVKFLRYAVVDAYNTIRCKSVPLSHATSLLPDKSPFDSPVSIAEVCFAGLPTHADVPVEASGLTARNVLTLQPDMESLRVLPYAPGTAMIMCTAHDQRTNSLSPFCTRGLLERVLQAAKNDLGVEFCVGAELEFQLFPVDMQDGTPQPVDLTTFANSVTLNEQEEFISDLHDQLSAQDIAIELIHAESAPGQLELVLSYSSNVMQVADDVLYARETISACAKKHGMKALFLPKTSMTTAGNGLHLHFSFRDVGSAKNAFSDLTQSHGVSSRGQSLIEGILRHLPSLLSLTMPTNNSFRRMGPGCWTGNSVGWATEDKEEPVRVCLDLSTGLPSNVEYKLADATANIYIALTAILVAGMNGMKKGLILRPEATDTTRELLPTSLLESLNLLKMDESLLSVFGSKLGAAYIAVRESEAKIENTLEEEVIHALIRA